MFVILMNDLLIDSLLICLKHSVKPKRQIPRSDKKFQTYHRPESANNCRGKNLCHSDLYDPRQRAIKPRSALPFGRVQDTTWRNADMARVEPFLS